MEYAKKMVLVPQETLTKLQSARRLEQTPTTRVVHGIDTDMRQLLERQDLTDDQKVKLYHQTLQRYMELNRQRMEPLTMTLQSENVKSDEPPKLERELLHTPKVKDILVKSPTKMKIPLKEEPEEDEYGLPRLFAEAYHLPKTPIKKKNKKKRGTPTPSIKPNWSPY